MTPRQKCETRYKQALADLFLVALLSAVNIVAIVTNASFSFPFSAISPVIAYALGATWSVLYGSEGYLIAGMILAVVIVGLLFVLWLLAKKRPGALLAATFFFGADTLVLLWFAFSTGSMGNFVIDIVFHVLVLMLLVMGVNAALKLRKMGDESEPVSRKSVDEVRPSAVVEASFEEEEAFAEEEEALEAEEIAESEEEIEESFDAENYDESFGE